MKKRGQQVDTVERIFDEVNIVKNYVELLFRRRGQAL
jgi:hypothetical protein